MLYHIMCINQTYIMNLHTLKFDDYIVAQFK